MRTVYVIVEKRQSSDAVSGHFGSGGDDDDVKKTIALLHNILHNNAFLHKQGLVRMV